MQEYLFQTSQIICLAVGLTLCVGSVMSEPVDMRNCWPDNGKTKCEVKVRLVAAEYHAGWTVSVSFAKPVHSVEAWTAKSTKVGDGSCYKFRSLSYNSNHNLSPGDELNFHFHAVFSNGKGAADATFGDTCGSADVPTTTLPPPAAGDGLKLDITVFNSWNGGFYAEVNIPINKNYVDGWRGYLEFSRTVDSIQVWDAVEDQSSGYQLYYLHNQGYNMKLDKCTRLSFVFLGYGSNAQGITGTFTLVGNPDLPSPPCPTTTTSTSTTATTTQSSSTTASTTKSSTTDQSTTEESASTTEQSTTEESTTTTEQSTTEESTSSTEQSTTEESISTTEQSTTEESSSTTEQSTSTTEEPAATTEPSTQTTEKVTTSVPKTSTSTTTLISTSTNPNGDIVVALRLGTPWSEGVGSYRFEGWVEMPVTKYYNGWMMTLTFDVPISNFQTWNVEFVSLSEDGLVVELSNTVHEPELHPGQVKSFNFHASFFEDTIPTGIAVLHGNNGEVITTTTTQFPTGGSSTSTSTVVPTSTQSGTLPPGSGLGRYNYGEVLGLSILFYEAQRSGILPANNRIPWRSDSALNDGKDNGLNLAGGWYDAGDHVKFGFPMAAATTVLAHGVLEFKDAYLDAGEYDNVLESIKWPLDYFIKCHTKMGAEFYGQVGSGHVDHAYWGRPEDMKMTRPSYKITKTSPGSDLAGETAAAFAAGSLVFRNSKRPGDEAYADVLLQHAESLFALADVYRGTYVDAIPDARNFYNSWSGYKDELAWAAAWLYRATGSDIYLSKAETLYASLGSAVEFSWDDKRAGTQVLLYQLTGKAQYAADVQVFVNRWLPGGGVSYTPKGLAWHAVWGPNRYAANAAYIALIAAKAGIQTNAYTEFAMSQIHYMLGDSGRSFVVGYGQQFPQKPHHRSSSCPDEPYPCDWQTGMDNPGPNHQLLHGALVGGPDQNDVYNDNRNDYIANEVANDYNAGFQSALAGLQHFFLKCSSNGNC